MREGAGGRGEEIFGAGCLGGTGREEERAGGLGSWWDAGSHLAFGFAESPLLPRGEKGLEMQAGRLHHNRQKEIVRGRKLECAAGSWRRLD